jgi:hypothetical protein
MNKPQLTTAQYAAVISTVAFFVSCGSLYLAKLSYDLSAAKDQRELRDKMPAVDVQIRPAGIATASVAISIINRAEINIAQQDITVEPSLEGGEFYFSNAQQSVEKLKSSLSLLPMGTIPPKGVGTISATLSPGYLSFMLGLAASALELSILRSPMSFSIEARSLSNSVGSGTATVAAAGLS